ncbi:zinc transporter 6-A-like [Pollicipes pollicipes]|uniref:zinc transporter 6-A-like n=1 Tax=Pollicipes pollicipes TaxID=41117 RepID=UPI001884CA0F|nr:zinc transporter 6-A-like [Pollicipes pollicipes]
MDVMKKLLSSPVTRDRRFPAVMLLLVSNTVCLTLLLHWCRTSNSMVLLAYTSLSYFHLLSLLTTLLSIWVGSRRPELRMSFGYERCEALAVFSSTVLTQLAALFVAMSCAERLFYPPDVVTGRLVLGAATGLFSHVLLVYAGRNRTLEHVIQVSPSSWLQEQFADVCHSLCSLVPGLGRLMVPRVHALLLLSTAGGALVCLTDLIIETRRYHLLDPVAGLCLSACVCGTMLPLCVNVAKSLLQTTPSHVVSQLDKCLREALTLDGVLEFRHEHFWTLSTGVLAGSLHVRVRRDANEQEVLSQVSARFTSLVHILTVQVFKDDWTRSQATLQLLTSSALTLGEAQYASPSYASPRLNNDFSHLSFSPVEAAPKPGATVVGAANGAPARTSRGAGDSQRVYLSALDEHPPPPPTILGGFKGKRPQPEEKLVIMVYHQRISRKLCVTVHKVRITQLTYYSLNYVSHAMLQSS